MFKQAFVTTYIVNKYYELPKTQQNYDEIINAGFVYEEALKDPEFTGESSKGVN